MKINGKKHYLWRAVDQDGEVVDILLQARRDGEAAKRFFQRLLRNHGGEPRKIVTDELRSYRVAHREVIPGSIHVTDQYANNRAEQSHEATRAGDAAVQVDQTGSKICYCPCCRIQSVQSGEAPCICWSLSEPQGKCVLRME